MTRPPHHGKRRKKSRTRKPTRPKLPALDVKIDGLAARGDGCGSSPYGPIFVAETAPGDQVRVQPTAKRGDGFAADLIEILSPGPDRVDPVCPHAKDCGGCGLQHISQGALAKLKRAWLVAALRRVRIDEAIIAPTISIGPATRRRMRLSSVRRQDRVILGFNRRASKDVIHVETCPVARPELQAILAPLRAIILELPSLGRFSDVQITLTDTGIDLMFVPTQSADPGLKERDLLTRFAKEYDIARIAWERDGFPEPVTARRAPRVAFGGIPVDVPMGGFLQPSQEGEAALVSRALEAIPETAHRVADLYCGSGSFALPFLAAGKQVLAVEGNQAAVDSLRRATGGRPIQTERRDLAQQPVSTKELNRFDAVLFDPPRAGAAEQAEALSHSTVPTVIAVSCNPSTLARDLAILLEGGYKVASVTPIDQFTWSAHLEAIAILRREDNTIVGQP